MKTIKFNLFNTLYDITFSVKVTKRVPKYVIVKPDTNWIFKGEKLKVDSVYMEESKFDEPGSGRYLRLSLVGTRFEFRDCGRCTSTVIQEKDLILHY